MSDLSHDSPGVHGLAQLGRNAIKRVSELERDIAKRDETIRQLRAQLDEYERAPTVAYLSIDCVGERYLIFSQPQDKDELQELIARPTVVRVGCVSFRIRLTREAIDAAMGGGNG